MWQSHKIKWGDFPRKLKDMCSSLRMKKQAKVKRERKSSKLKMTARSSKFSLLEKIPNEQTKGYLNLTHEVLSGFSPGVSKQFSKTVAGGNSERVSNKITILWYKRKHWQNYCTKLNLQQIYWGDPNTIKSYISSPLPFN